jgi:hypothetical protein
MIQPRSHVIALAIIVGWASACKVILPAHSRSEATETASIGLRGLSGDELLDKWGSRLADDTRKRIRDAVAYVPPDVRGLSDPLSTAVGMAGDYIRDTLLQEADRYTATYDTTTAVDGFWTVADGKPARQHIFGFELVRRVRGDEDPALELVCAILPSSDHSAFSIEPVLLRVNRSKAKVLSYQLKDWYTTPWIWLLRSGSSVDISIRIQVEALWTSSDNGSSQSSLCDVTLPIGSVDLDATVDHKSFAGIRGTWMPGIPVAKAGTVTGTGNFTIHVTVTENDPSNAQKYLRQAADRVQPTLNRLTGQGQSTAPAKPAAASDSNPWDIRQ